MMKVQQDNVDSYLEDIVIRAGERAADQEARQDIKEHAAAIGRIADEMDKRFVYAMHLWPHILSHTTLFTKKW